MLAPGRGKVGGCCKHQRSPPASGTAQPERPALHTPIQRRARLSARRTTLAASVSLRALCASDASPGAQPRQASAVLAEHHQADSTREAPRQPWTRCAGSVPGVKLDPSPLDAGTAGARPALGPCSSQNSSPGARWARSPRGCAPPLAVCRQRPSIAVCQCSTLPWAPKNQPMFQVILGSSSPKAAAEQTSAWRQVPQAGASTLHSVIRTLVTRPAAAGPRDSKSPTLGAGTARKHALRSM